MARSEWRKLKDFDLIASVFFTFAIYKRLSISHDEPYIYFKRYFKIFTSGSNNLLLELNARIGCMK